MGRSMMGQAKPEPAPEPKKPMFSNTKKKQEGEDSGFLKRGEMGKKPAPEEEKKERPTFTRGPGGPPPSDSGFQRGPPRT